MTKYVGNPEKENYLKHRAGGGGGGGCRYLTSVFNNRLITLLRFY